jgi:hypothetical protein
MRRTYCTYVEEKCVQDIWWRIPSGKDHLTDISVDWSVILRYKLKKWEVAMLCETTGTNTQGEVKEEQVLDNFKADEYFKDDLLTKAINDICRYTHSLHKTTTL